MQDGAEDPLFLAITRPPLLWGVPLEAVAVCVVLANVLSLLASGSMLLFLPIAIVLLVGARLLSAKDPLIFAVLLSWLRTRPRGGVFGGHTSARWWGGISMSPLRADCDEKAAGRG